MARPQYKSEIPTDIAAALGMVVIEFNVVELMLSDVQRLVMGLGDEKDAHDLASALYYTPKSNTGRIDMLHNVVAIVVKDEGHRTKLFSICERAKKLAGRRHDAVHSMWSFGTKDSLEGTWKTALPQAKTSLVNLSDLERIASDCRALVVDILEQLHIMRLVRLSDFPSTE